MKIEQPAFPSTWDSAHNASVMTEQGMLLLDYFAAKAMGIVSAETQEQVPATFWDTIKIILINLCHMHFLTVNYKEVEGARERIARQSYLLASSMLTERQKHINHDTPTAHG